MLLGVIERTEHAWRVRFYKRMPGERPWLAAEVFAPWRPARELLLGVLFDQCNDAMEPGVIFREREN